MDVGLGEDRGGWVDLADASRRPGSTSTPTPPPAPSFTNWRPRDSFAGRTALITGATSGLGRAFARSLSTEGAHVYLLDADLSALRRTAEWLGPASHSLVLRCDLGSVDDVEGVGDFLHRTAAPISLVIHAAGAAGDGNGMITASPVDQLDEHYLMAVQGPYVLNQQVLPQLSGGARIVFVQAGAEEDEGRSAHGAVLGAARFAMIEELRRELRERWMSVVSLRVDPTSSPDEVVEVAMAALQHSGTLELGELHVGAAAPSALA